MASCTPTLVAHEPSHLASCSPLQIMGRISIVGLQELSIEVNSLLENMASKYLKSTIEAHDD